MNLSYTINDFGVKSSSDGNWKKASIFSDNVINKKKIYLSWTKNGKGNIIERNWPDGFFWLTIESCKFSLFICEFSWHKLPYASSQAANCLF